MALSTPAQTGSEGALDERIKKVGIFTAINFMREVRRAFFQWALGAIVIITICLVASIVAVVVAAA